MELSEAQMNHCIEHVAEIALHTRFMAVGLMQAPPDDQPDLAGLFLELAGGPSFPGVKATPEAAQALLLQVRAGYKPSWARSKKGSRRSEFVATRAVRDLETSPTWLRRLCDAYLQGGDYNKEAARFLSLRRFIFPDGAQEDLAQQVTVFIEAFEARILQLAEEIQGAKGGSVVDLDSFRQRRRRAGAL